MLGAEMQNAESQWSLGMCYQEGIGVEKNAVTAFESYMKAAAQGLAMAKFCVGTSYASGYGVAKDMNKSFEWLNKAIMQGYQPAIDTKKHIMT